MKIYLGVNGKYKTIVLGKSDVSIEWSFLKGYQNELSIYHDIYANDYHTFCMELKWNTWRRYPTFTGFSCKPYLKENGWINFKFWNLIFFLEVSNKKFNIDDW